MLIFPLKELEQLILVWFLILAERCLTLRTQILLQNQVLSQLNISSLFNGIISSRREIILGARAVSTLD